MSRRLHVHHLITRLELGGAQQNTLHCVTNHDRSRFTVSLAAGPGGILDGEARRIPDAEVGFFPSLHREIRPWADLRFLVSYVRYLKRARVDILHTHSSKAGILGRFAGALAGVPVIIHTVHGWGFNDYQSAPVRAVYVLLEKLAVRCTDLLIAVSRENVERGLAEGIGVPSLYRVIRSGIDVSSFRKPLRPAAEVRKELGIPEGAPVVGTVGNFKPQKAPLDFIKVAAAVSREVPEARFVMLGDGELMGASRDLAASLGIADRVVFAGWRRDVTDCLHSFNVFLLSSLFEGLPRSVLQAMSAGLPVVATAAGGTPEAVRDGVTGHVTARGDVDAMARHVTALLKDPARARALGEAGLKAIGEEFEITKMLRDIEAAYMEMAVRKGLAPK